MEHLAKAVNFRSVQVSSKTTFAPRGCNGSILLVPDSRKKPLTLRSDQASQDRHELRRRTKSMKTTSLKLESLRDLLLEELRDLYNAEKQLVDALPKMSEAATSTDLKSAFDHHLRQTQEHVSRLKSIFSHLGEKPTGETCEAMKGLIKEGESFVQAKGNMDVRDAGLIGAAQRVEHYEMAGYGTARALARRLGEERVAEVLQKTLNEEGEANEKLTSIAERQVNVSAAATSH